MLYKNLPTWILVTTVLDGCSLLMAELQIRRLMLQRAFTGGSDTTHVPTGQDDITEADNIL